MKRLFLVTLFVVLYFFVEALRANENIPRIGYVYSTKNNKYNSIRYSCHKEGLELKCKFDQIIVTTGGLKALDLKRIKKEYADDPRVMEFCGSEKFIITLAFLEGRRKPKSSLEKSALRSMQTADFRKFFQAIINFCKVRSLENYIKALEIKNDEETRTCLIRSHSWNRSFFKSKGNKGVWISTDWQCSIQNESVRFFSRFEHNEGGVSWDYISRGEDGLSIGSKCKDLDENVYSWTKESFAIKCDHVRSLH